MQGALEQSDCVAGPRNVAQEVPAELEHSVQEMVGRFLPGFEADGCENFTGGVEAGLLDQHLFEETLQGLNGAKAAVVFGRGAFAQEHD